MSRPIRRTAAFLAGCLVLAPALFALDPSRPPWRYVQDAWDVDSGLAQGSVNALAQTSDGYLWVGTYDGLARFDGYSFETLRPETTPGLAGASIRALLVDRRGRLWIGTGGGGLSVRTADEIRLVPGSEGTLVRSLAEDAAGNIWIGTTSRGLFRISPSGRAELGRAEPGRAEPVPVAAQVDSVNAIAVIDDALWVGTDGNGVWRREPDGSFRQLAETRDALVLALHEDRHGLLWIGTAGVGALAIGRGGKVTRLDEVDGVRIHTVSAFLEDREGSLWMGTGGAGLVRSHEGRFELHSRATGLPSDTVSALLEDNGGSLWVGTAGSGLVRLQGGSFTSYTGSDGIPGALIYSVAVDAAGRVWAGGADGALVVREGGRFSRVPLPGPGVPATIRSIAVAPNGDLWVATYGDGLLRRRRGEWQRFTSADGLPHNAVRCVFVDRSGTVWAGTVSGLGRFADGRWSALDRSGGLPGNSILALAESPDGSIWVGTDGAGLARLRGGRVDVLTQRDGLSSNVVLSLRWASDGLWIGGNGGLSRWQDGKVLRSWTSADGLVSNNVAQLAEDGRGYLWVGTARGVMRIPVTALVARARRRPLPMHAFGRPDGMASMQCSAPSNGPAVDGGGNLWFSTFLGLAAVDPARLRRDEAAPLVQIERVLADGTDLGKGAAIQLPAGTARLEIHYTGISTRAAHLVRFRFRLIGFDSKWVDAGSGRIAYYTAVPPGSYRFVVQATNGDGATSQASLGVEMAQKLSQTLAFRATAGLAVAMLVLVFALLRIRGIRERHRELERQIAERTADLSAATERALAASRAKAEFLATMSHEIRTPLNAVVGLSGLLLGTELDATQREYLQTVRLSADALLGLINDILDFSKIEAGKYEPEKVELDVAGVLADAVGILGMEARRKGLTLSCEVGEEIPARLVGDIAGLRQVLLNLAGNAVKFTADGGVVLRVEKRSETASHVGLRFAVCDTGIGIAAEKLPEIFESFTQVEGSSTREHGGTGLGLAISKRLCELMGGNIGVYSEPEKGSTFWFSLELAKPLAVGPPSHHVAELAEQPVLVVDGDAAGREGLAALLSSWGARAKTAATEAEAMSELRRALEQGEPYTLGIVSAEPEPGGAEQLGRTIKADPELRETALVLLAAAGTRGDAARARLAGYAAYLTNPPKPLVLLRCLREVLADSSAPGEDRSFVTSHSVAKALATGRILVAEDNAVNQRVIAAQLGRLGCQADTVATGREALAALDLAHYDLVLMDCQMPEMDGYQATIEIRRREGASRRTPILAVTAHALKGDRERCLAAGMDDYIAKPLTLEKLEAAVHHWLGWPGDGGAARGRRKPPPSDAPVDLEALEAACLGDDALRREVVELFVTGTSDSLRRIREALAEGALDGVRRQAHALKGSSLTVGAGSLAAVALELERAAESEPAAAAELVARLAVEVDRAVGFLRQQELVAPPRA